MFRSSVIYIRSAFELPTQNGTVHTSIHELRTTSLSPTIINNMPAIKLVLFMNTQMFI